MSKLLLSPPTDLPTTGGIPSTSSSQSKSIGIEDAVDFLGMDDKDDKEILDIEPKRAKAPEDKGKDIEDRADHEITDKDEIQEGDEEDELKDLEDELQPPTEEQLELMTPVRRKEILKKYPTLFKDFPYLERAYYREQQFTELLPTIEDAKQAVESKQILARFEADVSNGNIQTVLESAKESNPEAFHKIADNYMAALANTDQGAYHHVLGNVMKHTIYSMVQEAKRQNNEALTSAAQILNQFIFGSSEFTPPTNLYNNNGQDRTISEEQFRREQEFSFRQLNSSVEDTNTKVNNTLKNTIDANIDPKSSMTDYVKKNASREALETLEQLITQDRRFVALADKLWERAMAEGYSKASVDRVKAAYLAKAKTLLPSVIKKARNEALRGQGKRVNDDEVDAPSTSSSNKGPVTPGRPRSTSSGKITKASDIPKGMKTLDFLMSD